MTFSRNLPSRFSKVDELTRRDHGYLHQEDECYFLGEYTARKGFAFSPTNNLIYNFKKEIGRQGRPEWAYKGQAIREAAAAFQNALPSFVRNTLNKWTFIPIPPSKAKGDPLYDDRMAQMLAAVELDRKLDVREIILQIDSIEASHSGEARPSPEDLVAIYQLDEQLTTPKPDSIAIVDDVLTTGAHFRASHKVLSSRFPQREIVGLFIARRVPEQVDGNPFAA